MTICYAVDDKALAEERPGNRLNPTSRKERAGRSRGDAYPSWTETSVSQNGFSTVLRLLVGTVNVNAERL